MPQSPKTCGDRPVLGAPCRELIYKPAIFCFESCTEWRDGPSNRAGRPAERNTTRPAVIRYPP